MKREVVHIDEEKCDGCGNCIPNCHEGALQIVDGKAVLVSDLMCDGLGACLGHCPQGALRIEKVEAQPYNETLVMLQMLQKGKNVVIAHLTHLKEHGETGYLKEGVKVLWDNKDKLDFNPAEVVEKVHNLKPVSAAFSAVRPAPAHMHGHGCPGSANREFSKAPDFAPVSAAREPMKSMLTHWPIQLHLINPGASHFQNADLLVAADCTAFSFGNFHEDFLKNKKLIIACPKLDHGMETYLQKLIQLISVARVKSITVLRMEVPCCGGLVQLVEDAVIRSNTPVEVKEIVIGIEGKVYN